PALPPQVGNALFAARIGEAGGRALSVAVGWEVVGSLIGGRAEMAARVRWGILGTARIGATAVIPAIRASRNGEVVAVASRDAERALTFAREHGIPAHVGSYDALLGDSGIEAVYIP